MAETPFDRAYYEGIWGTIHRHDYCEDRANWLISKYGCCRILDVGAGCGFLVKTLRDKGCDAYGLEISDYAISNSCCPSHVRHGDAKNMPFASGFFRVVHSNGLFGYDEDVQAIWRECKRVGKLQEHNIDYDDDIPEHQLVVIKPKSWWDNQLYPKILIAGTTFDGKRDVFDRWWTAYRSLTMPHNNVELLLVDNSTTLDYADFLRSRGIAVQHLDIEGTNNFKVSQTYEWLRKYFLAGDYALWFSLETDVLVQPDCLMALLKYWDDTTDWVGHCYRSRDGSHHVSDFGCSLFSRRIMSETTFAGASSSDTQDGYWWNQQIAPREKYKVIELYDVVAGMRHL